MNLLIAVKSCNKHRLEGYNDEIRRTWGMDVAPNYLLFFHGEPTFEQNVHQWSDEVILSVKDDYDSLPYKTQAILKFFLLGFYSHIFLCDTDTFVIPEKLLATGFEKYDVSGRYGSVYPIGQTFNFRDDRGNSMPNAHPWPSGGIGYFLSRRAAQVVVDSPITHWAEDVHVGQATGPLIQSGELTACDLPNFETEASWHFQRRQYGGKVYDLSFGWMEKMYKEHNDSRS